LCYFAATLRILPAIFGNHRRGLSLWPPDVPSALNRCYDPHQYRTLDGGLMRSLVRFSEDVVPLGDLKVNPGKVIRHLDETGRPVLLTSRGRGVAVVQALSEFEAAQEEREFMRAVFSGLSDLEDGRELPLAEARRRLGLV
jgi:prevent-host-death family protein